MATDLSPGKDPWSASLSPSHLLRHNREELLYIAAEPLRAPALAARRLALRLRGEKPLGYIGWIGHRNLGDEAMYHAIVRRLSAFPATPLMPPPGEAAFARMGVGGPGFFRAVLLGGGTLINPLYLRIARLARSFGAPFHTIGTGVGSPGFGMPLDASLDGWREVLSDSLLSVRGPLSRQMLYQIGLRNAVIIGDPALALTPDTPPPFRTRRRLVINLALEPGTRPSAAQAAAFESAATIARQFLAEGGEVVGVALGNGDRAAIANFRSDYALERMTIENHRTSAEGLLRTLTGSIGLIGMRLHSAVLACCVGVPPILMAYRNKCEDFMVSMDSGEFAIPLEPGVAPQLIEQRWAQIAGQPELHLRIYQKSLFWKWQQNTFYDQLSRRLRQDTT